MAKRLSLLTVTAMVAVTCLAMSSQRADASGPPTYVASWVGFNTTFGPCGPLGGYCTYSASSSVCFSTGVQCQVNLTGEDWCDVNNALAAAGGFFSATVTYSDRNGVGDSFSLSGVGAGVSTNGVLVFQGTDASGTEMITGSLSPACSLTGATNGSFSGQITPT